MVGPSLASSGARSQLPALSGPVTSVHPPLFRMCQRPRAVRCFPWPPDRNLREAYRCDGTCQGRPCAVPCECSCVDNSVIPRLIALRRIRQPELRPNDEKLWRTQEEIARLRDQRREFTVVPRPGGILEVRPNFTAGSGAQPPSRNDTSGLPFGIPDDILARLIAQPDLNLLIGPQGINDMLAGEPPILLPPGVGTNEPPLATTPVPAIRSQRGTSGGIPVALDLANFQTDPTLDSLLAAAERLGISTSGPQMGSSLDIPTLSGSTSPGRERIAVPTSGGGDSLADLRNIILQRGISLDGDLRNASGTSMMTSLPPLTGSQRDTCLAQGLELWCDAAQGWGQTPGVGQWCLLNCRQNACDSTQCTCECVNELEFRARYNQLQRSLNAVG